MKESNGLAIASLVLGIIGLVFSCIIIGVVPSVIGLILGIVSICQSSKANGMAVAGTICSVVGIITCAVVISSSLQLTEKENNIEKSELHYSENVEKEEIEEATVPEEGTLTEEPVRKPQCEFTYRNMTVKYLKHEVAVDSLDQTVLIIYYEFTNNSDENKTFDYSFSDKCFQNGVEVDRSYWHANDESKNSGKEIKSGTTITVASAFVLGDSRDDIELEITPWMRDDVLLENTLELE